MSNAKRIAVLISGRGSNLAALADAVDDGRLKAEIALVVANRPDAEGLGKAEARNIPIRIVPHKGMTRDEHGARLIETLKPLDVSLVCLAGYMRILSPGFVAEFRKRVVNIHPSLLPAFTGLNAQLQALEYGVKFTGCTVHFVDEELDHGPIVAQTVVPVLDSDTEETLSNRILTEEHRLYPSAVQRLLHDPWEVRGRKVIFS